MFNQPALQSLIACVLILMLSGCGAGTHNIKPITAVQENGAVITNEPLKRLLAQRKALCNQKKSQRESILREFREKHITLTTKGEKKEPASIGDQLTILLTASCDPAKAPGILHEALIRVLSAGKWPEDYSNFFDVLVSQQRSYAIVEKQYYDMRFKWNALELEYNNLKQQHENTITGLSEIEADLDFIDKTTAPKPKNE